MNITNERKPKELIFNNNDFSTDCVALGNEHLGITNDKMETSSVVILTPGTQDIIFVDDDDDGGIDTMDLMANIMKEDNSENLKKYESKR